MKKNQLKTYCAPVCSSVHVETSHLMQTSFPGQHNPAQPGGTISSAKAIMGDWEEGEEEEILQEGKSVRP